MKKRQFRYILSFLILTLFVFATLADSQESTEQITEEPNPTEQSATDQLFEEPNPTKQSEEDSNPLESQSRTLKTQFRNLEIRFNALEDSLDNSFQTYLMIFGALIALTFVVVIFLGIWNTRQQRNRFENIEQWWQDRFNGSEQRWEEKFDNSQQHWRENLDTVSQQGSERTRKLEEMESNQSSITNKLEKFQDTIAGVGSRLNNLDSTVANLESEIETNITSDNTVVYQVDVESTILETQERVEELARAYKDGEPIDLDYIEMPIPSHNLVLNINWIARTIKEWIAELEQSTVGSQDLIQTLKYAEQTITDKLKTIREESTPALKPMNLETNMELDNIRDQSITYPTRLEGVLIGYELGRKVDEATDTQFIPQFIKNNLFNNVAKYIPHDQLQEQLDKFLQLADYEVIPVEVGVTEADSRFYEIQGSIQTHVKRGTVAEVITPGLMLKSNHSIVQKPVVIRGE